MSRVWISIAASGIFCGQFGMEFGIERCGRR